jgi:cytochrome P450
MERQEIVASVNRQTLGEAYHPFAEEQREDPYPFYEFLRTQEPITYSPAVEAWLVTRYSDIRTILSQPDIFSSRDVARPLTNVTPKTREILNQGYPMVPTAISSDGFDHKRFRDPYIKTFSPARMTTYEGFIRKVVNHLVDELVGTGSADIITQFAYPLTLEVILHTMGIPQEKMADAKKWSGELVAFLYSPLSEEQQVKCAWGLVAFQHYIAQLIEERREQPQSDAISDLVHSQVPGGEPLSMNELVSALCGLVMAGHKTTVDLIGNGLVLLLNPRSRWQKLCMHPEIIPAAVEEILRYDSPVQALLRTTLREVTIGDVTLPAGARVLLIFGAANRDEMKFPQAANFDMQRTPNRHLGFGYGIHFCIGAPLARLEARVAFEVLTQRLPQMRLAPDQHLVHLPILAFRGYQRLDVEW